MRISRGGTKVRARAAKGAAKVVRVRWLQQGDTCTLHRRLSAVSSDEMIVLLLDSQGINVFHLGTIS